MGKVRWQSSVEELLAELRETESRIRRDYAVTLELIAELDTRGAATECGYRSTPELVKDLLRISRGQARRRLHHAHAVTEVRLITGDILPAPLPAAGAALRAGEISADHLDVVNTTLAGLPLHIQPEERETAEAHLVTAAKQTDPRTLATFATQVRAYLDQDGTPPTDTELANPHNEFRLTTKRGGRVAFTGELEPEAGALLKTVISPLAKPRPNAETGPDPRTPAERHGDALVELLHLAASTGGLPGEAGEKPHLIITIPLHHLHTTTPTTTHPAHPTDPAHLTHAAHPADPVHPTDSVSPASPTSPGGVVDRQVSNAPAAPAGAARLGGSGSLDAASARRIACDSKVIPAVLGSNSEVLDLGRANYTVNQAIRRALTLRDAGCSFPDCDRPSQWCHAHHVDHWIDGGATALHNLTLLCGQHHRLIHHSEWECEIHAGLPHFRPPRYIDPEQTLRVNLRHSLTRAA